MFELLRDELQYLNLVGINYDNYFKLIFSSTMKTGS